MMTYKHKDILSLFNKTDGLIVFLSLILTLLFFVISALNKGILHEFTINISASMIAIGATVLLVDKVREYRIEQQYKMPRSMAIKKITGNNSLLSIDLAMINRKNNPLILSDMMRSVNDQSSSPNIITSISINTLKHLGELKAEDIVSGYTNSELLGNLKSVLQNIRVNYSDTASKYMFTFTDTQLKADYADLLERLDSVIGSIEMLGIGELELEKLLAPTDSNDKRKTMTINSFIGTMLMGYIKSYNTFIDNYGLEDK